MAEAGLVVASGHDDRWTKATIQKTVTQPVHCALSLLRIGADAGTATMSNATSPVRSLGTGLLPSHCLTESRFFRTRNSGGARAFAQL
jgi:hypothetical protein